MKEREEKRKERKESRKIGEIGEIRQIREEKRERTHCGRSLCSHTLLAFEVSVPVLMVIYLFL